MQPTYQSPVAEKQGEFKTSKVGATERGLKVLIWMARKGTYDDEPLAVVREYIANALDEHRKHNPGRPIEIHCPTHDDLEARFRDFGLGLPEKDIRGVFGMMGESTKDEDEIGGFGIGAKVGNSYSDSFFVESIHGGEKAIYQFYLIPAEDPCDPPEAEIAEIYRAPSDEPTGVLVRVPVKSDDIHKFERAFQRVCFYLEGEYLCNKEFDHAKYREINGVKYCKAHDDNAFYMMQSGMVYAAEAPVLLENSGLEGWAHELKGYTLVLPKNSFDFTISREHVKKSALSRRALYESLFKVNERMKKVANRVLQMDLFDRARFLYRRRGIVKFLKLARPEQKEQFTSKTSLDISGSIVLRSYDSDGTIGYKSNPWRIDIPNPKKGKMPTIWYEYKDVINARRKKVIYAINEHKLEDVWVGSESALKPMLDHPILGRCMKRIDDIEVPRGYNTGCGGARAKVAVEVGDINKAKFYLISSYGKVSCFGSTYKVKEGMPYPIRSLGIDKWVVIVPKSQSKKLEGTDLIPFRENLKIIKRIQKRQKNAMWFRNMRNCALGSVWLVNKGLHDTVSSSTYIETRKGRAIRERLKKQKPLWYYAVEGGGHKHVYEEIKKSGLTKSLLDV